MDCTGGPSLLTNMKKFIVFVVALLFLVASEYYFLTELFTRRRLPVVFVSLACTVLCVFVFLRFFKNSATSFQR